MIQSPLPFEPAPLSDPDEGRSGFKTHLWSPPSAFAEAPAFAEATAGRRSLGGGWPADRRSLVRRRAKRYGETSTKLEERSRGGDWSGGLRPPEAGRLSLETGGPDRQPDREPVFVRHPKARRYVIRVRSDGTVRVTIPRRGSKRDAVAFVQQQHAWIARQLERIERARARPFDVTPPEVLRELREKARHELPLRLQELAAEFGLIISRVTVGDQRWRWGSCSPTGHISLNWRLVSMPDWVRDYVLIHELMHLKRLDHSPQFWKLVAAACPGYHAARKWLRTDARSSTLYCTDR